FRNNPDYHVVAFTAAQIPNIEGRLYPPELAGPLYPNGIPIYPEEELPELIRRFQADRVVFAYSDVSHEYVMHRASIAHAAGADFWLMGPKATQLKSRKPVVSIGAVRTGSGKSPTTRRVAHLLRELGWNPVIVRHPMPYGDLRKQIVQRFASFEDLDRYECTIEEREEYEPHLADHFTVYAGVDYEQILRAAEAEGDLILWDGGNNDFPFFAPDLHIVVADPHRPGHEVRYHPGESNLRMAHAVVINKIDTASPEAIAQIRENVLWANPQAILIEAAMPIFVEDPGAIRGRRLLVVEDGPTLTHGEMAYGAGMVAARRFGAAEIIDPRPYAVGSIQQTYRLYPQTGPVLPAMGYSAEQIRELEETINRVPCDLVLAATPVDLRRILKVRHPMMRVRYEIQEIGHPTLMDVLMQRIGRGPHSSVTSRTCIEP
ncbi:MAG: cyclic 2,3-diphosphoglycerate synthase, partial [Thermoflexus sp.]|nr:cyclic 2,3-diphosphoglycerate synthase [Thermoflexus sp.]